MKLSRKLAVAILPLVAILAGCQSTAPQAPTQEQQPAPQVSQPQKPVEQEQQVQEKEQANGASLEVFVGSEKAVKGYRPINISETQTIYVDKKPMFTRADFNTIEALQDNKGRAFVKVQLNDKAVKVAKAVPKKRILAMVVGGQLASLVGMLEGDYYLFMVRNTQIAQAIEAAVSGHATTPAESAE